MVLDKVAIVIEVFEVNKDLVVFRRTLVGLLLHKLDLFNGPPVCVADYICNVILCALDMHPGDDKRQHRVGWNGRSRHLVCFALVCLFVRDSLF